VKSGMARGMSKLDPTSGGVFLKNPPQTPLQRCYAESLGFKRLRSGRWVLPDPPRSRSIEVIEKYGPGHTCKACRDGFRSKKQRDPYCRSCRGIIDVKVKELTGVLRSALNRPAEDQDKARIVLEQELTCTFPISSRMNCEWRANQGRNETESISLLIDYLPGWITKAHCHHMKHVFWNRFPHSRRFFPRLKSPEQEKELYSYYYDTKARRKLTKYLTEAFEAEITYPEES
jgi:hypothetical protein